MAVCAKVCVSIERFAVGAGESGEPIKSGSVERIHVLIALQQMFLVSNSDGGGFVNL